MKGKALLLKRCGDIYDDTIFEYSEIEIEKLKNKEILIKVKASGICHTELDEIEGRTPPSRFPMILGHQVVGEVIDLGSDVKGFCVGDKVAVGWIGESCGKCSYCRNGYENLCLDFKAVGRDIEGGYAEIMKINENYAFKIETDFKYEEVAPLLCAGAVGYRALKLMNIKNGDAIGFTGFGASAHLILKLVKKLYPDSPVYVFARSKSERDFAKSLGALEAFDIDEESPYKCKAILDTTPVFKPFLKALRNLDRGGRLVINAIRKEETDKNELLGLNYEKDLWLEKEIKSVANVTRKDIKEFLNLAFDFKIKPEIEKYSLNQAISALREIKEKKIRGAKVIVF